MDLHPDQYGEADRREVSPPVRVDVATWSKAGSWITGSRNAGMAWQSTRARRPAALDQSCGSSSC